VLEDMAKWVKDMEAEALSRLQQGDQELRQHFKLVEGRGSYGYKDQAEAEKAARELAKRKKKKVADLFEKKFKSPAGLKKVFDAKDPFFSEHVVRSTGKPAMVPHSDPRPDISVDVIQEFDIIDEENSNADK
jgi:hypothetical protein